MRERLDCSAEPSSVRQARRFVIDRLQKWNCEHLADRAALVTSELATNALVHTGMPFSVLVEQCEGGVRVEVEDGVSEMPPHPATVRPVGATGTTEEADGPHVDANRLFTGLGLVDAVATRWGSNHLPAIGKVVWVELVGRSSGHAQDNVLDLRDRSARPERRRVPALFGRRRRVSS